MLALQECKVAAGDNLDITGSILFYIVRLFKVDQMLIEIYYPSI